MIRLNTEKFSVQPRKHFLFFIFSDFVKEFDKYRSNCTELRIEYIESHESSKSIPT